MSTLAGNWSFPTPIRFGVGRIAELAGACGEAGITRPLLVTDRGLAGGAMVAGAVDDLRAAGLPTAVFSDFAGDPTLADVIAGGRAVRAHRADGVVALGGGASLDAGKAIALATFQDRPLWAFEDLGDNSRLADPARILPVVAVPTTAGTGSEVGRAAVVLDAAARVKRIIFHPLMLPRVVIADPALTAGLPPALTAATGMDALSHNLEAFFAPPFHPMARGIAAEGVRLVATWLPRAVREGDDLEARAHMLAASQAGATAFQRGLGAMHALAHPLGAHYGVHHGLLNAVLAPYVLAANLPAVGADARFLARVLEVGETGGDLLAWLVGLRREIGIPHTLAEVGIPPEAAAAIPALALADPSAATNPVAFAAADYERILRRALAGDVTAAE